MIRRNFSSQSSIAVITGRKGSNHDFTEILFTRCSNTDFTCHKASNFGQICDSQQTLSKFCRDANHERSSPIREFMSVEVCNQLILHKNFLLILCDTDVVGFMILSSRKTPTCDIMSYYYYHPKI